MDGTLRRVRRRLVRLRLGNRVVARKAPRHVLGGPGLGARDLPDRLRLGRRPGREGSLPGSAITVNARTTLPCGTGPPGRVGDGGVGGWLGPRDRGRGCRGGRRGGAWLAVQPVANAGVREAPCA